MFPIFLLKFLLQIHSLYKFSLIEFQHLTSLSIVKCSQTTEEIELILSLTPSLIYLKLVSHREQFDSVFDGSFWERTIENKLPQLERFQIFFSYKYSKYGSNFKSPLLSLILEPFQSIFWLNKKFINFSVDYNLMDPIIRLYTTPICTTDKEYAYTRCIFSSRDSSYSISHEPQYGVSTLG